MPSPTRSDAERDALITAHLDVVETALAALLRRNRGRWETIADDLRGEGYLALVRAAEKCPDLDAFRPYAYYTVRAGMLAEARKLLDLDAHFVAREIRSLEQDCVLPIDSVNGAALYHKGKRGSYIDSIPDPDDLERRVLNRVELERFVGDLHREGEEDVEEKE